MFWSSIFRFLIKWLLTKNVSSLVHTVSFCSCHCSIDTALTRFLRRIHGLGLLRVPKAGGGKTSSEGSSTRFFL